MNDPADASFWDETYESGDYLNHWDYSFPSHELVAAVALRPPTSGEMALDLGCGAGREAIFLATYGFRVIAVDISAKALEIARNRARDPSSTQSRPLRDEQLYHRPGNLRWRTDDAGPSRGGEDRAGVSGHGRHCLRSPECVRAHSEGPGTGSGRQEAQNRKVLNDQGLHTDAD